MSTKANYLWATLDKIGGVGLAFLFNLVMARWFLSPREFGIIGMLQIFISIGNITVIAGFGQSLVQTRILQKKDISTVFSINLLLSFIIYIVFYISAPAIASFYNEPILKNVLRVLGLQWIICSFLVVQYNLALRYSQIRKLCIITIASSLLGYTLGIILAAQNVGVWSLVIATNLIFSFQVFGLWLTADVYPNLKINLKSFQKLIPYSGFIYVATLIDQVYIQGLSMILGKRFSATTLGFYTQANKLQMVPSQAIQEIGYQVLFPNLSRNQSSPKMLKEQYRKNMRLITSIGVLAFSILFLIAKPAIIILLTEKWLPSVPILRILSIVGFFLIISFIPTILIRSVGKAKSYFNLIVFERLVGITLLVVLSSAGIYVTLWGLVGLNILYFLCNVYYVSRLTDITIKEQLSDVFPILLPQIGITIAVDYGMSLIHRYGSIVEILTGTIVPTILFVVLLFLTNWISFQDFQKILSQKL